MKRRCAGAALVLVVWLLLLLTGVVGAFALTARVEYLQARVLAGQAGGAELARAGLEYAIWRLQGAGGEAWQADGRRYDWTFDGHAIELRITDEAGKVDLNQAEPALLAALLRTLAVEPSRAAVLATAIVDHRTPRDGSAADAGTRVAAARRFVVIDELQQLPGIDATLYQALRPLVTVHGRAQPEPRVAPAPVLQALGLDAAAAVAAREAGISGVDGAQAAGSGLYAIDSVVRDVRPAAAIHALVRLQPDAVAAYTVVRWEQGAGQQ